MLFYWTIELHLSMSSRNWKMIKGVEHAGFISNFWDWLEWPILYSVFSSHFQAWVLCNQTQAVSFRGLLTMLWSFLFSLACWFKTRRQEGILRNFLKAESWSLKYIFYVLWSLCLRRASALSSLYHFTQENFYAYVNNTAILYMV